MVRFEEQPMVRFEDLSRFLVKILYDFNSKCIILNKGCHWCGEYSKIRPGVHQKAITQWKQGKTPTDKQFLSINIDKFPSQANRQLGTKRKFVAHITSMLTLTMCIQPHCTESVKWTSPALILEEFIVSVWDIRM